MNSSISTRPSLSSRCKASRTFERLAHDVADLVLEFGGALSGDGTLDGKFAGLGAEYALSDSMSVGGEVLQHSFEDDQNDFDMTTVQARVNFRF